MSGVTLPDTGADMPSEARLSAACFSWMERRSKSTLIWRGGDADADADADAEAGAGLCETRRAGAYPPPVFCRTLFACQ